MMKNQQGIAHLVLILFLVAAIGAGTYIVRQRTNLVPFAQEACQEDTDCGDLPQYCEEGQTKQCTGGYCDNGSCVRSCGSVEGDPLSCAGAGAPVSGGETGGQCSESKYYCDYNADPTKGKRILKTGGYFSDDPADPLYGERDSSGCVYDFQDKGACDGTEEIIGTAPQGQSGAVAQTCPDEGLIYCEAEGKKIEKYNARWNSQTNACDYDFREVAGDECIGKNPGDVIQAGTPSQVAGGVQACTGEQVNEGYVNSKLETNLLHYYAIITGTPERCVKADLTLPEFIYADGVDGGTGRRLFLCSGKDGSIKWRVVSADGSGLVQTKDDFPTDPNDPNFPGKDHVTQAENLLGIKLPE